MNIAPFQPSLDWTPERLALVHDAAAALLSKSHRQDPDKATADLYWLQDGPHHAFKGGLDFLQLQLKVEHALDDQDAPGTGSRRSSQSERKIVADGLRRTAYACIGGRSHGDMPTAIECVRQAEPSSVVAVEHFDEFLGSRTERDVFESAIRIAKEKHCRILIYARSSQNPAQLTDNLGLTNLFRDCAIRIHDYPGRRLLINPTNDELFRRRLVTNISDIKGLRYNGTKDELADQLVRLFQRTAAEVNSGMVLDAPERGVSELIEQFFIDPQTNLRLPPLPRIPYSGRTAKYGKRLTPEEFVRAEWGDYAEHHLLYADSLREIDYSLYKALDYQSRKSQSETASSPRARLAEYAEKLGILSREHVVAADPRFKRQVALLGKMRAVVRAHKARERASALLAKIP